MAYIWPDTVYFPSMFTLFLFRIFIVIEMKTLNLAIHVFAFLDHASNILFRSLLFTNISTWILSSCEYASFTKVSMVHGYI